MPGDLRRIRNSMPKMNRPVSAMAHKLRTRMRELLQAQADDEDDVVGEFGRLQSASMVGARLGKRDVFFEEGEQAPGLNTAIEVLVDGSGSMSKIAHVVTECLVALGDACAEFSAQVDLSMSFFNSGRAIVIKADENWKAQRSKIAQVYSASGGTEWANAAMTAIGELSTSRRDRKILLTITDGDLDGSIPTSEVVGTAKAARVELVAVALGVDLRRRDIVVENVAQWDPARFVKATHTAIQRAMQRA